MRKAVKRSLTAGALVIGCTVSGIAWASWVGEATGAASAQAGHAEPIVTVSVETAGAPLYPGGTGDLVIKLWNPNPFPVRVMRIELAGPIVADQVHHDQGCTQTGVIFPLHPSAVNSKKKTVEWSIGGEEMKQFTLAGEVRMTNQSHNSCQGATFTIPVELTAESAA